MGIFFRKIKYAWVIVLITFVIYTVVFGIQYSFGIFFTEFQETFGWTRANTSFVMTVHLITFSMLMIPVSWAINHINTRILFSGAAVIFGTALILCSQVSSLVQLCVVYGIMLGCAISIFGPLLLTIVTRWFVVKRGIALGIASSGVGFGTLIVAPVSNHLISICGWRETFIILGIIAFVILLICAQFIKIPGKIATVVPDDKKNNIIPKGLTFKQSLKTRNLLLVLTATVTINFAVKSVMVHITPHFIDIGINLSVAALAVGIIGGSSIIGRIVMGLLQDRAGAKNTMLMCFALQTLAISILFFNMEAIVFVFAILFGFAYGGDVPQVPVIISNCFGDFSMSSIYGLVAMIGSIAGAAGPYVTGYIYDVTGSYNTAFIIIGVGLITGLIGISKIKLNYA